MKQNSHSLFGSPDTFDAWGHVVTQGHRNAAAKKLAQRDAARSLGQATGVSIESEADRHLRINYQAAVLKTDAEKPKVPTMKSVLIQASKKLFS